MSVVTFAIESTLPLYSSVKSLDERPLKTEWIDNVTIVDAAKLNKIEDQLETLDTQKVSRDGNKGLSSNDFTDAYKTKLDNLEDTIAKYDNIKYLIIDSDDAKLNNQNGHISDIEPSEYMDISNKAIKSFIVSSL